MAAINLQAYKVVTQELSSATKFNNLVQAIQDAFTVGTTDIQVAVVTFGGAADTNLYRATANALKTDDSFTAVGTVNSYDDVWAQLGAAAEMHMGARGPAGQAGLLFGQGASADTNLYRSAADILKTDDKFIAVGGLGGGYTAAAVGGAQSNKVPWYDNNGTLVGYIPIYAT